MSESCNDGVEEIDDARCGQPTRIGSQFHSFSLQNQHENDAIKKTAENCDRNMIRIVNTDQIHVPVTNAFQKP